MVDRSNIVCCMCGDVGFRDKLFRCHRCLSRFQHPYCSNYYNVNESPCVGGICDWCRSEERNAACSRGTIVVRRSKNSGSEREDGTTARAKGNASGTPGSAPKHAARRYKLLKDVMC